MTNYNLLICTLLLGLLFITCSNLTEQKETVNWPSFRGSHADGIAAGQNLPNEWDGEKGLNIKWKTLIPGLAHSSPVVWGDKLFITTAISSKGNATFKHGLYGDGDASKDLSIHKWDVLCLNKKSGEILWQQTAFEGVPKDKRHIKSTYANSTPATDGRFVATLFGSEGLCLYDIAGNQVWKKKLGRMDVGAYDKPEYEWGPASSPIIYENMVIVQVDAQGDDFLIACDIKTGETIWKTEREELPSWGTPTIVKSSKGVELVTNSSNFIYGYNPVDGMELWRLGGSSQITAPTPIFSNNLIVVASGRRPNAPIFAIRTGAKGDITLKDDQTQSDVIVWSKIRRGSYMPTPLIYEGLLYVLNNNGRLDCYDLETGEEYYRESVKHAGGGFSASPVAADGMIFLPSEDGIIYVVEAGKVFKPIAENRMGELVMATPAISGRMMFVRGEKHVFAVGK